MVVRLAGGGMVDRDEQLSKAQAPMAVTVEGRVRVVSDLQYWKPKLPSTLV